MKKIIPFLLICLMAFTPNTTLRADEEYYYAKVEKSGTYLYLSADETSPMFEIPTSYFVKLTSSANDLYYCASYQDVSGYIKKSEVSPMQGQPSCPYVDATLRVFSLEGLGLYSSPSLSASDLVINVPYLSKDIVYYGKTEGVAVPNKSNIWYYCKYNDEVGYLYSVFCDELSPIPVNNEFLPLITTPLFQKHNTPSKGLSDVAKTFIILGVSLPCALIIYLLIKPTFSTQKTTVNNKAKRRRRRGDYFEFDENDLT